MPYQPPVWPVHVKAVVLDAEGRVLLSKNDREEWELPGGPLDSGDAETGRRPDASPESAVERHVLERTGLLVEADALIDDGVWILETTPVERSLIVTYGCSLLPPDQPPPDPEDRIGDDHKGHALVRLDRVRDLEMAAPYKRAILSWSRRR
ncbi:NUDIX domain-containing protein [Actinacidiphila alni]|uniref:NUDIX domain-containing protein n=1 Tax=Actinacidiphila alni TaxID=380248 RepID=A0A1I2AIP4_9ACTN|nr:NUDIX hydrolase [Actinacidiphila alni]SFE43766.1 NUDIX domain-containing protein [Actinacidiphila alni]